MTRYIPPEENKNTNTQSKDKSNNIKRNTGSWLLIIIPIVLAIGLTVFQYMNTTQADNNINTEQSLMKQEVIAQSKIILQQNQTLITQHNQIISLQKRIHDLQNQQDLLQSCMSDSSFWRTHKLTCKDIGVVNRP